jgi:hypothetical protein
MKVNNQNKKPEKRETFEQKTVRDAWAKKQNELDDKNKDDKDQRDLYERQQDVVAKYDELMDMLTKANKKSKTTKAMNNLIDYVYASFGKNPGTNTNRKVSGVIENLTKWEKDREAKINKNAEIAGNLSEKKRLAEERRKQAKIDDAKMRNAPSSSSAEQGSKNTLKALQERNKASIFNKDIEDSTKTQAIENAQKQVRKFKYL